MNLEWFQVNDNTIISIQSPYGITYRITRQGEKFRLIRSSINGDRWISTHDSIEQAKLEVEIILEEIRKHRR